MNELVLVDPNGSQDQINKSRMDIMTFQREIVARIEEATEAVNADGIKGHTRKAFDEIVTKLNDAGKSLADQVAHARGADAILVQLGASIALIKGAIKGYQSAWDEAKAWITPPAQRHTYVLRLTCTDAALDKLCKCAMKEGAEDVLVAVAQSDKAIKQIAKWFEENV